MHETRRAELQFSEAMRRQREKEEQLQALQETLREAGFLRPGAGVVRSSSLQNVEARREDLERRIRRLETQLQSLSGMTEKMRQVLKQRKTVQESLERLKERQLERHLEDVRRAEVIQSDEQAIAAFNRR